MRKLLKLLTGKKILSIMFLALQLAVLVLPVLGVYERQSSVTFIISLAAFSLIIYEINRPTDSGFKMIWIAIIAIFPVFGIFLYFYVHSDWFVMQIKKALGLAAGKISRSSRKLGLSDYIVEHEAKEESGILSYLAQKAQAPCFRGGDIKYFSVGEDMFSSFMEDIKNAESYIFLEYFIINEEDYMWKELFGVLSQKAREGIDVRIIYDAMGCITTVGGDFDKRVRSHGIKCYPFSPVKPFISTYHNNRDHRKIAVIDGKCAYTGGINIADEYINRKERFGHWKDTAIRVEGESVAGFMLMFFKLWSYACPEKEDDFKFFPTYRAEYGKGFIVPFDDTPFDAECVSRNVYLYIINSARDYVYINTPYLILDDALSETLKFAAKRGVDVRICMPHIPDKKYAFSLGRSYYPDLISNGVKIYEYKDGFLHAKSTVSDDKRLYVGSANYDYRSLYLHYECGAYIYDSDVIFDVKTDFEKTLSKCIEFTIQKYKSLNVFYRISGRILRLFAALM